MAFLIFTLVFPDKTSPSPSIDSITTSSKAASINSSKTLSAIQLSDKKLSPFLAVTLVFPD
jgi:hypothetical protein